MCAYNVFRRRSSDQFCLVAGGPPVAPFLSDNLWEFTGRVPDQGRTLPAAMASHLSSFRAAGDDITRFQSAAGLRHP
jgi:hypothetical protein